MTGPTLLASEGPPVSAEAGRSRAVSENEYGILKDETLDRIAEETFLELDEREAEPGET